MMNRASALSLLSNAVLVWNSVHVGRIAKKVGASEEVIRRVSPLASAHVIPSGTYHFRADSPGPLP